jgi:hypothetical protein
VALHFVRLLIDGVPAAGKLSPMSSARAGQFSGLLVAAVFIALACSPGETVDRQEPPPDTPVTEEPDTTPAPVNWSSTVGRAVIIPSADGDPVIAATGVAHATLRGATVLLLGRSGVVDSARIAEVTRAGEGSWCSNLPHARLDGVRGTLMPWRVGLVGAGATGVLADSISGLPARDSAAAAAMLLRAASRLRNTDGRFDGLPFSVHAAWRVNAGGGDMVHVAQLIRRINVEANPLEERSFLVLEPRAGADGRELEVVYSETSGGSEAAVEAIDLLAAVRPRGSSALTLLLAREGESGIAFSVLERTAPRSWALRWTSDRTRCE